MPEMKPTISQPRTSTRKLTKPEENALCLHGDGYPIKRGWPELDLDAGCSWWDATEELEKPR